MAPPLQPGSHLVTDLTIDEITDLVGAVPDPEVPVLTIADLGVLRGVEERDGVLVATITPTYSGCPAMEHISAQVAEVLASTGRPHEVRTTLSPAWTTEWISAEGRVKLRRFGIAPPQGTPRTGAATPVTISPTPVPCPRCGSRATEMISEFGSTACKSLHRCRSCLEPFDHFKDL